MKQKNAELLAAWEQRYNVQKEREVIEAQLDAEDTFDQFVDRSFVFVTGILLGFNFALLIT